MMLKDKCRVCLGEGIMRNIFEERYSSTISLKVMSLAKVKIYPEDRLPSTICSKCVQLLDNCSNFIQLCQESDAKLRNMLLIKIESPISLSDDSNEQHCANIDISKNETNTETITSNVEKSDVILTTHTKTTNGENCKTKKQQSLQQCTFCGKILSSRFRLQTHLRTHTGERPFPCPHCSKSFSLKSGLDLHIRIHTGEKPLQCKDCEATFRHPSSLRAHRRTHTGETPYQCLLCPKSFHTASNLQYHIRNHTGEKNFECDSCGKAFISRSHLQQHLLLHSGERPHMCSVCGLRLTRVSHLRRHMLNLHKIISIEPSQVKDKKEEKSKSIRKKTKLKESSQIKDIFHKVKKNKNLEY